VQATVLITPELSAIAGHPDVALPPVSPGQDADTKGPVGGAGEADALRQQVYNPSFDVTPAELVAAIVTEKGVAVKRDGEVEYALSGSSVV
jgi:translation initiation factor 2B subunit (eIF-2B alpha/beta/delta family)